MAITYTTVDEYISQFPEKIQDLMQQMRSTIREAAPQAIEKISWGMATYDLHGNLVHFSAQKKHIGFHPAPSGIDAYRQELEGFSCSKGTIRLPYDKPLPLELVRKIVLFRVSEQEERHREKGKRTP